MESTGRYLRESRERLGRTLEDMARETRIPIKYLAALEEERFHELPSTAHVKGFISSYCKALKVDPTPALQGASGWLRQASRHVRDNRPLAPVDMVVHTHRSNVNWTYVAIVLVFVIGLLVAILSIGPRTNDSDLSRALDRPKVNHVLQDRALHD